MEGIQITMYGTMGSVLVISGNTLASLRILKQSELEPVL
jgi:hypothetical protein